MPLCLLLGADLTALLLVDAVVVDLMLLGVHILGSVVDDMYAKEHQVNYHGIDKKQRREIRAKKQAQGHTMSW